METTVLDAVEDILRPVGGNAGICAQNLVTGDYFGRDEDTAFIQASVIKVPILVELFRQAERGEVDLDERVVLAAGEIAGGSGILQWLTPGLNPTIRDLGILMMVLSDNIATNLLIDLLGTERVTNAMAGIGLSQTRLRRRMMDLAARQEGRENVSTPREMARLFQMLHRHELVEEKSRAEMMRWMSLPKASRIAAGLPPDAQVVGKAGSIPGVVNEAAMVEWRGSAFILTVMFNQVTDHDLAEEAITNLAGFFRRRWFPWKQKGSYRVSKER